MAAYHCDSCSAAIERLPLLPENVQPEHLPACKYCKHPVAIGWIACEPCIYEQGIGNGLSPGEAYKAVLKTRLRHTCTCNACLLSQKFMIRMNAPAGVNEPMIVEGVVGVSDGKEYPNPLPVIYSDVSDDTDQGMVIPVVIPPELYALAKIDDPNVARAGADVTWKAKDGRRRVRLMTNDHLLNTVRLLASDGAMLAKAHVKAIGSAQQLLHEAHWRGLLTVDRPLRGISVRVPKPWEPLRVYGLHTWFSATIRPALVSEIEQGLHRMGVWSLPEWEQAALPEPEPEPEPPQPYSPSRQATRKIRLD